MKYDGAARAFVQCVHACKSHNLENKQAHCAHIYSHTQIRIHTHTHARSHAHTYHHQQKVGLKRFSFIVISIQQWSSHRAAQPPCLHTCTSTLLRRTKAPCTHTHQYRLSTTTTTLRGYANVTYTIYVFVPQTCDNMYKSARPARPYGIYRILLHYLCELFVRCWAAFGSTRADRDRAKENREFKVDLNGRIARTHTHTHSVRGNGSPGNR